MNDDYRSESRRAWGSVAAGWAEAADEQRLRTMPVIVRMIDLARLQPGSQVLELSAGIGDVGFLALETIQPGGSLITSDFAPEMLDQAQQRAASLGLEGVRFKQIDAESIDLEAASLDAVLCRWGFMLMADPQAALRESRRVLRPGGRLSLAAWADAQANPWSALIGRELVRAGLMERPQPGQPGQFAWGEPSIIEEQLADAGFVEDIEVEGVDFTYEFDDVGQWLDSMGRLASKTGPLVRDAGPELHAALREAVQPFADADGRLEFPARTWVAGATA